MAGAGIGGGHERDAFGHLILGQSSPVTPTAEPGQKGWTASRVVGVVLGSIAALVGVALALGGAALILAYAFGRDSDGYYSTDSERFATRTYVLTADNIDLGPTTTDVVPKDVLGHVRIQAERPGGRPVFVGIGPIGYETIGHRHIPEVLDHL